MALLESLFLKHGFLEGKHHLLVGLRVEASLVASASLLLLLALLDGVELLVLLQVVQGLALLFNHVAVREREVVQSLHRLEPLFVLGPLLLLVFENLVGLDEGVGLVGLVSHLQQKLLAHHLALVVQQALLVLALA